MTWSAGRRLRLGPAARALRRGRRPVWFGSLASTRPVATDFGYARGTPVDRRYIESFLAEHRDDITGHVLEVKDSGYTERFGHAVIERGVLDVDPRNPRATYVADLAAAEPLPAEHFDCFLLTQTLQFIPDVPAALAHAHRVLRPGGVLLATVPVASRVCDPPLTDLWRFTPLGIAQLVAAAFGAERVAVTARGNVLATVAFLEGLSAQDLHASELGADDPSLPLIACVRAIRAA